jgi:Family of unknown function (DUF5681)
VSDHSNGNGNGGDGKYQPVPPTVHRWKPGQSGNPKGRGGTSEVKVLAREHTAEAVQTLVKAMRTGHSEKVRVAAAIALLDRGWDRPVVTVQRTDFEMAPVMLLPEAETDSSDGDAE